MELLSRLKSLVGRETVFTDSYTVEPGMIRRFAEATGDDNPLYRDGDFAGRSRYGGIIAPPTFVFEWHHHEAFWADDKGQYLLDVTLPLRMVRAGNDFEFGRPLRPGDVITTTSRVKDVFEKTGASGRMAFVVCESRYTNQEDELLGVQRSTIIIWI